MNRKELIGEIESRFNLIIAISTFFPVLLGTYFGITGGDSQMQTKAFVFFGLAGLYLLSYFFFELAKNNARVPEWALRWLGAGLLIGIVCFVMPIVFLVSVADNQTQITWAILFNAAFFKASLWGMQILAILITIFAPIGVVRWAAKPKRRRK